MLKLTLTSGITPYIICEVILMSIYNNTYIVVLLQFYDMKHRYYVSYLFILHLKTKITINIW